MQTNEFRVRPVQRFVLTHYQESSDDRTGSCRNVGEFPSVEAAEEVGIALQALVPGSLLTTLDGRQPHYPPKALAAAMAVAQQEREAVLVQYVAVERGFNLITNAVYFDCEADAEKFIAKALQAGREYRLFSRPVTDPIARGRMLAGGGSGFIPDVPPSAEL